MSRFNANCLQQIARFDAVSLPNTGWCPGQNTHLLGGAVLIGFGIVLFLVCEIYGIATIIAGGKDRKHQGAYWFCFVLAIITLLNFPIGTVLGIFSLIVLSRPSVKGLFQGGTLPGATVVAPPA
jgi:hypothetical protein